MKLKAKQLKNRPPDVDKLAETYLAEKEQEKQHKNAADEVNAKIKAAATHFGKKESDRVTIKGQKFEVGFQIVGGRMSIDDNIAQLLLKKDYDKYCKKTIDPELIEKAVQKGDISSSVFKRMLVKGTEQKRILIIPIGQ